ncbi:isopeptide-forming domain-containing fimbrial protein [Candidatus Enterococcus ikei]|uniref:Isopeptide-forming domain-containing fimbrial protein n=1 Tax=Candidatus Enterococcus ikei TaxID=2815326 RepID=A0ABS3GX85_9ENTE|nr:isopeptide-forming domain-containing fimbrial protein [Enterococcus sp. DIV0869a]MBO0439876.1 isopeptide-forming domain-containing fimbrial protein [Enterococcus sp. DIV0869a]
MKTKKGVLIVGCLLIVLVIVVAFRLNDTKIKAEHADVIENSSQQSIDPLMKKTEEELHAQEDITLPQMNAFMEGRDYLDPQSIADGKITGGMTNLEYQLKYKSLNAQQNDAWNAKYNFRPETNVKHVSTYAEFAKYYEDNGVSKIVLDNDIVTTSNTVNLGRTESIEIDGQGYLLRFGNGSINLSDLTNIADFGQAFSDVPVFHMHDIQVANGNAAQIEAVNSWGFVNGRNSGDYTSVNANPRNGLWRYRIGNVYTPSGSAATNNQNIRGRLICANRAEVSVWGYNKLITGAENFYTGGMTYEPYAYYSGKIAYHNYSTIWFIQPVGTNNDSGNSTGTMKFDIGEGAFVYLHNTRDTSTAFPGVYEHFDQIKVGKNATYNANIAGSALSFNRDNSSFLAEEGSTVNLLSRRNSLNYPTLVIGSSNSTHATTGVGTAPRNVNVEFKSKSKVFIVGSNNSGVIGYRGTSKGGSQVLFDNPETFDIRNLRTNTGATRAFLGDENTDRGNHKFIIRNSDISIWENSIDMDGAPTYDYADVQEVQVTNAVAAGSVTSTNDDLRTQYTRSNFKRISGMNSTPKLNWIPVTDADYSQKGIVQIGYTAVGGEDPFDENGDAKVKPVYADDIRKAYVDYIDTLGNTYTGVSTKDNYVHWKKADHAIAGFQLAGKEMKGTPKRATLTNGVLTPYRIGEVTATTVIDVTPPDPAKVESGKVTNATKQLTGVGAESGAQIYIDTNGIRQAGGTVNDDGTWVYDLPGYLSKGDVIEIFLEDSAGKITEKLEPAAPSTNNENGNINPTVDMNYRDATFKAITKYVVEDVIPDQPTLVKTAISSGGETTSVGDIVTYTLKASNPKADSQDWKKVRLVDQLAEGLEFDPSNHGITINGEPIQDSQFEYEESTRTLTILAGDIAAKKNITATFNVKIGRGVVGEKIKNKASALGDSPQETPFVPGPTNPNSGHVLISVDSQEVPLPGDIIHGIIELSSFPTEIDFGKQRATGNTTRVETPEYSEELIVSDNRGTLKEWMLTVKVDTPMTSQLKENVKLPRAIRFSKNGNESVLDGNAYEIFTHKNDKQGDVNITETWKKNGQGFKLEVPPNQIGSLGVYKAILVWELADAPLPTP